MSDISSEATSKHVLVLDQDPLVCSRIRQLLDNQDFVITTTHAPEVALDHLRFGKQTLLIMEQCPQTNQTLELLKQVRHCARHVQVILYTNDCSIEIAQEALNLDVFALVKKTDATEELLKTVHRAIHQYDAMVLQRSEMRFASIVNDLSDMVIRYTPDGTITFANRVFMDFFDVTALQIKGKQIFDIIEPVPPIELNQLIGQFTPHDTVQTIDVKIQSSRHRDIWFRWTNRAIFDNQDRMQEIQSTLHDITDSIYSERYLLSRVTLSHNQLDQTYKQLAEEIANHEKTQTRIQQHEAELAHVARLSIMGEMASSIAHELNQPLAAIANYTKGCIKRLKQIDDLPPSILQAMEATASQSDRAGQILRRLRDMVQKRPPMKQPLSVTDIFQEIEPLILPLVQNKGMKLKVVNELSEQLVNVDSIQIQQVFINLTRNAIEAMLPINDERNLIKIHIHDTGHETIEVQIIDQGHGLKGQAPSKLFDMFYSTNPEGMGIGLPICRTIIESHGGNCQAQSHPDGGAIFSFSLPIYQPSEAEQNVSNQLINQQSSR